MRVKVNSIYLNCEITGSGDCIVFIHGLGADLTLWQDQVSFFSTRYQVLTFDVRGAGHSDKPPGPYSMGMFADDLHDLLRVLGIQKAIAVGHSMGGMIAQTFALEYAGMLRALVLADTAPVMPTKTLGVIEHLARTAETRGMEPVIDGTLQNIFSAAYAQRNPRAMALHREQRLQADPRAYAATWRAIAQFNTQERLGSIAYPTLIIVADQDLPAPLRGAEVFKQGIRGSKLAVIKDSGHHTMLEQPETFNAVLMDFLDISQ